MVLRAQSSNSSQSKSFMLVGFFFTPSNALCNLYCTIKSLTFSFHKTKLFLPLNYSTPNFSFVIFPISFLELIKFYFQMFFLGFISSLSSFNYGFSKFNFLWFLTKKKLILFTFNNFQNFHKQLQTLFHFFVSFLFRILEGKKNLFQKTLLIFLNLSSKFPYSKLRKIKSLLVL